MSEIQSMPTESHQPSVNHLALKPLNDMAKEEELAWYSTYVDAVVPESNIEWVGFHRIEIVMDQEAFEAFVIAKQKEMR